MTAGAPLPGIAGSEQPPPEPAADDILRIPDEYAATLIRPGGEHRHLETILDINPVREHTALSDWTLEVPADRSLEAWARATIHITYDTRTIFVGRVDAAKTGAQSAVTTLSGTGPGGDLRAGDVQLSYQGIEAWRAIEDAWNLLAPEWDVTVVSPVEPRSIEEFSATGEPLDVLAQLHEEFAMRFMIDHRRDKRAISFPKGRVVRSATWHAIDQERTVDVSNYHNAARVRGARRPFNPDLRFEAYYEDDEEIERLMDEYGMSREAATSTWSEIDPSLETHAQCMTRAQTRIEELTDEDTLTGTIEVFPRLIDPGVGYTVDEWDNDRVIGAYSLRFAAGSQQAVALPVGALRNRLESAGAFTLWVRPDSDPATAGPPLGSEHFDGANSEVHIRDSADLPLWLGNGTSRVEVPAHPEGTPQTDEWTFAHYDWDYDAATDETTVRAGTGGAVATTATLAGRPVMPDTSLWLGRRAATYYTGYLDDVRLYAAPLAEATYARLSTREPTLQGIHPRSRWPLTEGQRGGTGVYDVTGGWHGTNQGATYAGNPLSLERVSYSEAAGQASGTLRFERIETLAADIERLRRDQERVKETL